MYLDYSEYKMEPNSTYLQVLNSASLLMADESEVRGVKLAVPTLLSESTIKFFDHHGSYKCIFATMRLLSSFCFFLVMAGYKLSPMARHNFGLFFKHVALNMAWQFLFFCVALVFDKPWMRRIPFKDVAHSCTITYAGLYMTHLASIIALVFLLTIMVKLVEKAFKCEFEVYPVNCEVSRTVSGIYLMAFFLLCIEVLLVGSGFFYINFRGAEHNCWSSISDFYRLFGLHYSSGVGLSIVLFIIYKCRILQLRLFGQIERDFKVEIDQWVFETVLYVIFYIFPIMVYFSVENTVKFERPDLIGVDDIAMTIVDCSGITMFLVIVLRRQSIRRHIHLQALIRTFIRYPPQQMWFNNNVNHIPAAA